MTAAPSAFSRLAGTGRQTIPENWTPYNAGLMGLIPRRGTNQSQLPFFGVGTASTGWPSQASGLNSLRLLQAVASFHPAISHAEWTLLRMACAPEDFQMVAYDPLLEPEMNAHKLGQPEQDADKPEPDEDDSAREGDMKIDAYGTAQLDALWANQPPEIGGLHGLRVTLTLLCMYTGLCTLECTPDVVGQGVRRVLPVDSMTVLFGRDSVDSDLAAFQHQLWPNKDAPNTPGPDSPNKPASFQKAQTINATEMGWKRLNPETFFWNALDNFPDDPYGRAPYAPVLTEVLRDIALMKDIHDMLHHAAWPRIHVGFDFTETYRIAVEVVGIRDAQEASDWVAAQFQAVVNYVATLKADDALVTDKNVSSDVIEGGKGLGNLSEMLAFLRHRIVQGLKTLPSLMGIQDGGTQTRGSVEFGVYAQGVETFRHMVAEVLVRAADLHLRLLGLPLKAKCLYKPIRTNDAQVEAATKAQETKNALTLWAVGWISWEASCRLVTGNSPVKRQPDPALQGIVLAMLSPGLPAPSADATDSSGDPNVPGSDTPPGGIDPTVKPKSDQDPAVKE